MDKQANYFSIIPANVRYDKNLSASEKMLYAEITSLANKNGYCWATNQYFSEVLSVSKRTISRVLRKLEARKYIKIERKDEGGTSRKIFLFEAMQKKVKIDEKMGRGRQNVTPPSSIDKMSWGYVKNVIRGWTFCLWGMTKKTPPILINNIMNSTMNSTMNKKKKKIYKKKEKKEIEKTSSEILAEVYQKADEVQKILKGVEDISLEDKVNIDLEGKYGYEIDVAKRKIKEETERLEKCRKAYKIFESLEEFSRNKFFVSFNRFLIFAKKENPQRVYDDYRFFKEYENYKKR
ncbi:MAG: helix-turn-helix domain-containing protein [Elusimicrobiota bacterium]|jgi:DNA-binding MarR family transcriptional regulator|nr:helix-turn-helix domain-containing protein [Elusimicrobiota bacterium]